MKFFFILLFFLQLDKLHAQHYKLLKTLTLGNVPITYLSTKNGSDTEGEELVLIGNKNGEVALLEPNGKIKYAWQPHQAQITHVSINAQRKWIVTAGYDGQIKIWHLDSLDKTPLRSFDNPSIGAYSNLKGNEPTFALFVPNKPEIIFGGYNAKIFLGNIETGEMIKLFENNIGGITAASWLNENTFCFAVYKHLYLFDIEQKKVVKDWNTPEAICEIYTTNDETIWTWTYDGNVMAWKNYSISRTFSATAEKGSSNIAFIEHDSTLITGHDNQTAKIWDLKKNHVIQLLEHEAPVLTMAALHQKQLVYTGDDTGIIKIWEKEMIKSYIGTLNTNIEIQVQQTIQVQQNLISMQFWDDQLVDGDTISVSLNGKWIAQSLALNRQKKYFVLPLNAGENTLILYAHNVGKIPPNTACVTIGEGKQAISKRIYSYIQKAGAIKIFYNAP